MKQISPSVSFFLTLAKTQAIMSRRFDAGLGGLGFGEFAILYHLSQARDGKMRRTDLAEKIGLTASGVTRLLLPMEKIGLVRREANKLDARVSLVSLAHGGKAKLAEGLLRAEEMAEEIIPQAVAEHIDRFSAALSGLANAAK